MIKSDIEKLADEYCIKKFGSPTGNKPVRDAFIEGCESLLSAYLPTKEDVQKEADRQISYWLDGSTKKEKEHYKVAFRRCFEYIVRFTIK